MPFKPGQAGDWVIARAVGRAMIERDGCVSWGALKADVATSIRIRTWSFIR